MKVLIVEDNPSAALAVKFRLTATMNVDTVITHSAQEAIQAFKNDTFVLIIMDIGLGAGLDGAEATEVIRSLESELGRPRTWVYALTAHISEEDLDRQKSMGIDKIFEKPISDQMIAEILEDLPILKKE